MAKLITVTEVSRSLSDIVNRVYYMGESYDIKKGVNIVARLLPAKSKTSIRVEELNNFFENLSQLDQHDIEDFEKSIKESRSIKTGKGTEAWD